MFKQLKETKRKKQKLNLQEKLGINVQHEKNLLQIKSHTRWAKYMGGIYLFAQATLILVGMTGGKPLVIGVAAIITLTTLSTAGWHFHKMVNMIVPPRKY